jgi:hypothetical protein
VQEVLARLLGGKDSISELEGGTESVFPLPLGTVPARDEEGTVPGDSQIWRIREWT